MSKNCWKNFEIFQQMQIFQSVSDDLEILHIKELEIVLKLILQSCIVVHD